MAEKGSPVGQQLTEEGKNGKWRRQKGQQTGTEARKTTEESSLQSQRQLQSIGGTGQRKTTIDRWNMAFHSQRCESERRGEARMTAGTAITEHHSCPSVSRGHNHRKTGQHHRPQSSSIHARMVDHHYHHQAREEEDDDHHQAMQDRGWEGRETRERG